MTKKNLKLAKATAAQFAELRSTFDQLVRQGGTGASYVSELEALLGKMRTLVDLYAGPRPVRPHDPPKPSTAQMPTLPAPPSEASYNEHLTTQVSEFQHLAAEWEKHGSAAARKALQSETDRLTASHPHLIREFRLAALDPKARNDYLAAETAYIQQSKALDEWKAEVRRIDTEYESELARWRARKGWGRDPVRARAIRNCEGDLDLIKRREHPSQAAHLVSKVSWEFLPPPGLGIMGIESILQRLKQAMGRSNIDMDRLKNAYLLQPSRIYVGRNEFDGYVAFHFNGTSRVLLENPIEGNAAYVFDGDWRALSKLSRSELLIYYKGPVTRVIHTPNSDWKSDIRRLLGI